jgi:peptidoglycan/xylan/chitin deacetylase (PgdA/CDA1 family)
MKLILTYHQVLRHDSPGDANFYTVTPELFGAQLEILRRRGGDSIRIDDLLREPSPSEKDFVLTFDDDTADHYETVFPMLEKHGFLGTFFVATARLNQPGRLTDGQILEMSAAGHCFGSHSHEHKRMDVLCSDEIRYHIQKSRDILSGLTGVVPVAFAPPGGYLNQNVKEAAYRAGMRALRTMRWGYNQNTGDMDLETLPVNQYTDEAKFLKLLEARGPSLVYAGKESLKRVIPSRGYEWLRRQFFKTQKSYASRDG